MVQVLLVRIGSQKVDNNLAGFVVQQVESLFQSHLRVTHGGLFILIGLIHAIGSRVNQFVPNYVNIIN